MQATNRPPASTAPPTIPTGRPCCRVGAGGLPPPAPSSKRGRGSRSAASHGFESPGEEVCTPGSCPQERSSFVLANLSSSLDMCVLISVRSRVGHRGQLSGLPRCAFWAIRQIALVQRPWADRIGAEVGARTRAHGLRRSASRWTSRLPSKSPALRRSAASGHRRPSNSRASRGSRPTPTNPHRLGGGGMQRLEGLAAHFAGHVRPYRGRLIGRGANVARHRLAAHAASTPGTILPSSAGAMSAVHGARTPRNEAGGPHGGTPNRDR